MVYVSHNHHHWRSWFSALFRDLYLLFLPYFLRLYLRKKSKGFRYLKCHIGRNCLVYCGEYPPLEKLRHYLVRRSFQKVSKLSYRYHFWNLNYLYFFFLFFLLFFLYWLLEFFKHLLFSFAELLLWLWFLNFFFYFLLTRRRHGWWCRNPYWEWSSFLCPARSFPFLCPFSPWRWSFSCWLSCLLIVSLLSLSLLFVFFLFSSWYSFFFFLLFFFRGSHYKLLFCYCFASIFYRLFLRNRKMVINYLKLFLIKVGKVSLVYTPSFENLSYLFDWNTKLFCHILNP